MPSINAATISPPAGKRWREAPEGGHRESCGHTASVTDVRNPAIARWQTQFHDGTNRARCELCPRRCVLKPGQRGFCFVRSNHDGLIVSDTYGRSSGFAVDPVEKKAAQPLPPRFQCAEFRHGWLQFRLPILPKLGYCQSPQLRPARHGSQSGENRAGRGRPRHRFGGVHL